MLYLLAVVCIQSCLDEWVYIKGSEYSLVPVTGLVIVCFTRGCHIVSNVCRGSIESRHNKADVKVMMEMDRRRLWPRSSRSFAGSGGGDDCCTYDVM